LSLCCVPASHAFLFCVRTPPPLPSPCLCPYTTLFRSVASRMERALTKAEILELYLNSIYLGRGAWGIEMAARSYFDAPGPTTEIDRKSTRLNSSHGSISYAVFCLKKKMMITYEYYICK